MIKGSTNVDTWTLVDTERSQYNAATALLYPNYAFAEATSTNRAHDILSNGFKLRGTDNSINQLSQTFIYAAFAENPFKYARAR